MTAIEVAHLVKRYQGARRNAVDGISFDVPAGQLFCLLGPNGAGKTTTVSVLTTTLAPTAGPGPDRRPGPGDGTSRGTPGDRRRLPAALTGPEPHGRGEHPAARGALRPVPLAAALPPDAGRLPAPGAGTGRRPASFRCLEPAGAYPVRRDAAQAGDRPGAHAPARSAFPRRADRGPGPGRQAQPVGLPAAGQGRLRYHRVLDHALPGGGRGGRCAMRAGQGKDHRARQPGRGQGAAAQPGAGARRPGPGRSAGRAGRTRPSGYRGRAGWPVRAAARAARRAQRPGHHRLDRGRADPVPDRRADARGRLPAAARASP